MALILIIDDSSFQRGRISEAIKAEGYDVLEASNGREGLEILTSRAPDCIMMDLTMPQMDGFAVLKALQERKCSIPKIVLTADIQATTRKECLDLGACAFINKPIDRIDLRSALKKAFDS